MEDKAMLRAGSILHSGIQILGPKYNGRQLKVIKTSNLPHLFCS